MHSFNCLALVHLERPTLGSDPAAFCLGRPGLYVRELNSLVTFIIMKGNDIHSGQAPWVSTSFGTFEDWAKTQDPSFSWNTSGPENRAVYVCYIQKSAFSRNSRTSVFDAQNTFFGNYCNPIQGSRADSDSASKPLNFAENGETILGDSHNERMTREIAMQAWNESVQANIANKIGGLCRCTGGTFPVPPHPLLEQTAARYLKGRYQYFRNIIQDYTIPLSSREHNVPDSRQESASTGTATGPLIVFPENRCPPATLSRGQFQGGAETAGITSEFFFTTSPDSELKCESSNKSLSEKKSAR